MKQAQLLVIGVGLASCLNAAPYGFSDYYFVDPDRQWHIEGAYRWIGSADFEKHQLGHLNYIDANTGLYYTQSVNDENTITYGIQYDFLKLHWTQNPCFSQSNFNYLVGSLGYVSTTLDRWRWIMNAGVSLDTKNFNLGSSSVYHGLLWGRYHIADDCGVHVGALGWYGIKNGRSFPIFGVDWKFNDQWHINTVFPIDYSISYLFDENWAIESAYSSFGGPYKYPRRAYCHGSKHNDPIFMIYSKGVDLTLKYQFEHLLRASLGIGWNFGGWILIRDYKNHHGKYYHFGSAPYAQGSIALTF